MRARSRALPLLLALAPLLVVGPLISLAGSLSEGSGGASGLSSHLGAVLLLAALLSLAGSAWGLVTEPRPWAGWQTWPFIVTACAAILLAGIWWLYFGAAL